MCVCKRERGDDGSLLNYLNISVVNVIDTFRLGPAWWIQDSIVTTDTWKLDDNFQSGICFHL